MFFTQYFLASGVFALHRSMKFKNGSFFYKCYGELSCECDPTNRLLTFLTLPSSQCIPTAHCRCSTASDLKRVFCAGLGAAQMALATSMEQFEFACIGASMTEDERVISRSLHHFATLIRTIEDERDRMVSTLLPTLTIRTL